MSVKSWGTGRPDYMKAVISSRPVIVDKELVQIIMIIHKTYSIAAGAVAIDSFYTVPAGYSLSLGGGYISVKDSCINKLRLVTPSEELVGEYRYDMRGDMAMTALTGQDIAAGTAITAYVYNNDTLTSDFSLLLSGVLTRT